MRPEHTPEQEELRQAVRAFCAREVTPERLRTWEESTEGVDAATREAVARLGWIGLGVPADRGGSGGSLVDVATLLAECGGGLLPRPLIGEIRGASALAEIAPESPLLPDVAAGRLRVALALDEPAARSPSSFRTAMDGSGDGAVVRGEKAYVPGAAQAELHLVAVRDGAHPALVVVDARARGVACTPLRSFGGEPQAHVRYDGAPVVARAGPPGAGAAALARLSRTQRALALAEMVGGMEAVLATTVAYVKEREQFGQKIALFQAVRHQVADMGIRLTASRHLAWQAITRVAARCEQGHELASALAWVGRSFKEVCATGHHLHGGAGFVVEHRLRFHSERAQSLAIRYAPEAPALAEIASALLGGGGGRGRDDAGDGKRPGAD